MKAAFLLFLVTVLSACGSTRDMESRISTLESENARLRSALNEDLRSQLSIQQETLAVHKRNECILRHNDAKQTCEMLFRGEPNGAVLQNKLLQCLSHKGYPKGLATCK